MNIGVDFDNTIVRSADIRGMDKKQQLVPLVLIPGARESLIALKNQGHNLLVISRRSNLSRRFDPYLDPLIQAGVSKIPEDWNPQFAQARLQQMLEFVGRYLGDVVDAVDIGRQGRPDVDYFIDDSTVRFRNWTQTMQELGQMMAQDEQSKAAKKKAERK